ncbi:MAG: preprotein translocase subunit YajC [Deltaproteobacteria bacterium]|nr:preprotein translocase subunit YajC [Deltaproteobacteria bacterium]
MVTAAYAMGGIPGGGAGGETWQFLIMLAVLFGIFYFLLIRPQQKQQKEHKAMLEGLAHGDEVITSGGVFGKVVAITETVVTLEIYEKVRIRVGKNHITAVVNKSA